MARRANKRPRDSVATAQAATGESLERQLEETESRLRLFTEQIPMRATGTDRSLRFVWDVGSAFPSVPSVVGRTAYEQFEFSPDRDRVLDACRKALEGESSSFDIDDGTGAARLTIVPLHDAAGNIDGVIGISFDITERVRAEQALRKTESLLIEAEKLGRTGSWERDLSTGQVVYSQSLRQLFFGDDESRGSELEDYLAVVHPDDRESLMRDHSARNAGMGPNDIEFRIVRPDGKVHVISSRATVMRDESGKAVRVLGTSADITERKRAEEELASRARQMESLSRQLIQTQDDERRSLARELHDDVGQTLFALKLSLQKKPGNVAEHIALIDSAVARMRDLVHALAPPVLSELGLEAALDWYVKQEAQRAGIVASLAIAPLPQRPPVTVETTLYRVTQEALSNIIRHAKAHSVRVELTPADQSVVLVVRDDGRGFDVTSQRRRAALAGSLGLISMQERVALAGGELQIESSPGKGTTIRARVPLTT